MIQGRHFTIALCNNNDNDNNNTNINNYKYGDDCSPTHLKITTSSWTTIEIDR